MVAECAPYRIEPSLVYALVAAESNFDPAARSGEARGLLQLTPGAWRTVSHEPYESLVWDWHVNLRTGIEYLAWCRHALHQRNKFSYPLLLAVFHYGYESVQARDFDLAAFPPPGNPLYRELWRGNLSPLAPPVSPGK